MESVCLFFLILFIGLAFGGYAAHLTYCLTGRLVWSVVVGVIAGLSVAIPMGWMFVEQSCELYSTNRRSPFFIPRPINF